MGKAWKNIIATALVWGSFLLAHQAAYFVAFPNAAERAHELSHSGHGWLASSIHYGIPALFAILTVGLFSRSNFGVGGVSRAKYFGFGTVGLFITVEIAERALSAVSPHGHGFAINWTVITIGAAIAFILGSLVSALYYTVQQYAIQSICRCIDGLPIGFSKQTPRLVSFEEIKTTLPSIILTQGLLRGPPLKV
jgi:hypothetical protein